MMYLVGQIMACMAGAYLGAMSAKYGNWWILLATCLVIVGVAMSMVGKD